MGQYTRPTYDVMIQSISCRRGGGEVKLDYSHTPDGRNPPLHSTGYTKRVYILSFTRVQLVEEEHVSL